LMTLLLLRYPIYLFCLTPALQSISYLNSF
jgi:hypothetical protein